jgi:methyltransferase (TIGR00027 family)
MDEPRAARRRRSLIAGANAWFRAYQTPELRKHEVLDDPWAGLLADRDPRLLLVWLIGKLVPRVGRVVTELTHAHCIRHRTIDDLILKATQADGFEQVVLIGAGYDMRPSRFARELAHVHWIELDDPHTQRRKWHRLRAVAGVRRVALASADLESESLDPPLTRAAFDRGKPTCFVLEGVVHYLSSATLHRLLDTMAAVAAPVRVILSFIDPAMRATASPVLTSLFRLVRELPRSFMQTSEVAEALQARGFSSLTSLTLPEQLARVASVDASSAPPIPARWWQTVAYADRFYADESHRR